MPALLAANRLFTPRLARPKSRANARWQSLDRTFLVKADGNPFQRMEQLKQAMQDPKMAAKMKEVMEVMQRPEVREGFAKQMQSMQQRMKDLKIEEDPEFAPMFEAMKKGSMPDPKMLEKLAERMGMSMGGGPAGAAAPAAAPAAMPPPGAPEITNLLDAAKYGDLEAVEDFIAIGKDVNMTDKEGRTPLHFAAAYAHSDIASALLEAGAALENVDSMGNTPLHYAAGYGRKVVLYQLATAGASVAAKNGTGKTPLDLVKGEPRNPLHSDPDVVPMLEAKLAAQTAS